MSSIIQIQSSLNVLAREVLNIITSIDSEESSYSDVTDDGNSEKKDKDKDDTDNDDDEEGAGAGLGGAANSSLIAA